MVPRDASATRRKLLEAARDEFAEHGISGGRIDRIAERAGVNKERVYGHFGSKEELFKAVLIRVKNEQAVSLPTPGEDIGGWVGRVYDSHMDDPTMIRLMMWESLHYGGDPAPYEEPEADHYADKIIAVARTLGIEPDDRAARIVMSLLGVAAWPIAMPQTARMLTGRDPYTDRESTREHVVRMANAIAQDIRRQQE
ncbi:TetR/AcrR family transcriptional regulator [Halostreptopolyspora alba]|uniref:TetR/AcrR family transcriptional regulator n=1 Tax=Halostreptopolyspora alba TaxID=2487137 RepID=A0A3N0ECF9_9ACTN|nr:TetR/AcrR family transcriptional regulator [Nocardiopsaceae bacterium YIM 96095]